MIQVDPLHLPALLLSAARPMLVVLMDFGVLIEHYYPSIPETLQRMARPRPSKALQLDA